MSKLTELESFMSLIHDVERIKRIAQRPNENQFTSTAEHTFELVMMCWYIIQTNKLDLNLEKVLKYSLAHDLVEGWAGDTYIGDAAGQATKKSREQEALEKMRASFPEFPELIEAIESYEKKEDKESIFVYAADKLIDPINGGMETKPTYWKRKENKMTCVEHREYKDPKIALSKDIQLYWEELCVKLEDNKKFYFDE